MFEDYRKMVFAAYEKQRDEGALSLNLLKPTSAKLRAECLHVYAETPGTRDDNTLRLFFGPKNGSADFSQNIKKLDADKFKPLVHFLTGKTSVPEEKNIELLAWLINFEKRPYVFGRSYREGKHTDLETNEEPVHKEKKEVESSHTDAADKKKSKLTLSKAIASFILIAFTGGLTYLFFNNKKQHCMCWTGDRYQPVPCDEKIGGAPVVALDVHKLTHLKKITRPDQLTTRSLGKIWYVKVNGVPEFYTSAGECPEDHEKKLLPVTEYILNKYIFRKSAVNI